MTPRAVGDAVTPAMLRAPLLVALLVLAPLAAALPAEAGVSLAARAEDGAVVVDVAATGDAGVVRIVVTHEDPLAGTVVDAVVDVDLAAEAQARVRLDGLRADVAFDVRVVAGDVPLPTLPNATGLLDGARVDDLPAVASARVPPLAPSLTGADASVVAYRVANRYEEPWERGRAIVTADGLVVVGYSTATVTRERVEESHGDFVVLDRHTVSDARLVARVSRDGGRAFGPEIRLSSPLGPNETFGDWTLAERADGGVSVAFSTTAPCESGGAWTFSPNAHCSRAWWGGFDPRSGAVAAPRRSAGLAAAAWESFAAAPDGSLLAADAAWEDGLVLRVWRLRADAEAERVATLPVPQDGSTGWSLQTRLASRGESVALAGVVQQAGGTRAFWTVSQDGGRTFPAPREATSLAAGPEGGVALDTLAVDALGDAHAGLTVRGRAVAARLPADAAPATLARLDEGLPEGEGGGAGTFVAAAGTRLWAFFGRGPADAPATYAVESVDAGVAWLRPYRLVGSNRTDLAPFDAGVLPDGRPVLLAQAGEDLASLPLFDPFPDPRAGLDARVVRPWLARPVALAARLEGDLAAGTARLVATLRNDGADPLAGVVVAAGNASAGVPEVRGEVATLASGAEAEVALDLKTGPGFDPARPLVLDVRAVDARGRPLSMFGASVLHAPRLGAQGPGADVEPVVVPGEAVPAPSRSDDPVLGVLTATAPAAATGAAFAAAAVVGAGAWFGGTERGRWRALGLAALYTRLRRADVLRHEVRAGVHAAVVAAPGARFESLRRQLGLGSGALAYHLRVLEREGHVAARVEWTRRAWYPVGQGPRPEARPGPEEAVARLLAAEPGLAAAEVARRLGVSRQLAHYHLRALERAGRVEAEREGAAVRWRVR